jgi:iron-sulfur cluster assembly accessory protein
MFCSDRARKRQFLPGWIYPPGKTGFQPRMVTKLEVFGMSEAAIAESVVMTESAAKRISEILKNEPAGSVLRIGVDGGGCSGFQYNYNLTQDREADDLVLERAGAIIVIDPISLDFLKGCEIDFIDNLMGRMFKVNNPAATASCGCGSSFAI